MAHHPFPPVGVIVVSAKTRRIILGVAVATVGMAFLIGGSPAFAQTTPLPPGTTTPIPVPTVVTGTPPLGGTLLQEVQSPVLATNGPNTISGTVTSAAFLNGSGFLDFFYQFAFDANTNVVIDTISLSSFTNVTGVEIGQTDEDIDGGGLPAQNLGGANQNNFTPSSASGAFSLANRPNVNGDGINVQLLTGVNGDATTFTLIVRTQATGFSLAGSASVQGGGISAFTLSQGAIAPVASVAPEPNTLSLLAVLAMGGIAPVVHAVRRRRLS